MTNENIFCFVLFCFGYINRKFVKKVGLRSCKHVNEVGFTDSWLEHSRLALVADLAILVYLTANQEFGKFDIKQRNLVLPTSSLRAQSPKLKTGKRLHILL
jgi:hypothetical protein